MFGFLSQAQTCHIQNINIETQSEWDIFVQEIESCTHLVGTINISDNPVDPLVSFHGIENITTITGSLEFTKLSQVDDLTGWENLTTIIGNLTINNNPGLIELEGLHMLQSLTGSLTIRDNPGLNSLNGLRGINGAIRSLYLSELPLFETLQGLDRINHVSSVVSIRHLNNLQTLDGMHLIQYVGNGIDLSNLPSLTNLNGLRGLQKVEGIGLKVFESAIGGFDGLTNLSYCSFITLANCHNMVKAHGLPSLTTLYQLMIGNCFQLEEISGFENIDSLKFGLMLNRLPSLKSFSAFPNIQSVEQFVMLNELDILEDINGFDKLDIIKASIEIKNCTQLKTFSSIKKCKSIKSLILLDLDAFDDSLFISELEHLGNLRIENCNALNSLSATSSDRPLHLGGIRLRTNASLIHMDGLERAYNAINAIFIEDNPGLERMTGLKNIRLHENTRIQIQGNRRLDQCAVPFLCTAIVEGRDIFIQFNRGVCSNVQSIRTMCTEKLTLSDNIKITPNPATDILRVEANYARVTHIEIMSADGHLMGSYRLTNFQEIDIRNLPPGLYFIHIEDSRNHTIKKLIKI